MTETKFQEELQKLEKGIRELESGRLDLDEALKRFEEGVALTRRLRAKLDEAEGRVEQLLADGSTQPLDVA
ncbi:MAG TPA: exodeoxyribonuclease VII small subunit [Candidatus Thermoplasmatota archaeon]|nr:exodeoxyribonuclease VII small subunit [Candidatus Thermoplasmatota archaeon]